MRIAYQRNNTDHVTPCPVYTDVHVGDDRCQQCDLWRTQTEKPRYAPPGTDYTYDAGHVICVAPEVPAEKIPFPED